MTEYRNPRPGRPDTQYPHSSSLILTPPTTTSLHQRPSNDLVMAFAAARIIKDKKDQQELKMIKSPECLNVTRTGKKVNRYTI